MIQITVLNLKLDFLQFPDLHQSASELQDSPTFEQSIQFLLQDNSSPILIFHNDIY